MLNDKLYRICGIPKPPYQSSVSSEFHNLVTRSHTLLTSNSLSNPIIFEMETGSS